MSWVIPTQSQPHFMGDETKDHTEIDNLHKVARLGDAELGLKAKQCEQGVCTPTAEILPRGLDEDVGTTVGTVDD